MVDGIHSGKTDGQIIRDLILTQLFVFNERFGKIEGKLVADRADKNPGGKQFVVCLPKRMGKNASVSLQIGFIGAIILIGQKVGRGIV